MNSSRTCKFTLCTRLGHGILSFAGISGEGRRASIKVDVLHDAPNRSSQALNIANTMSKRVYSWIKNAEVLDAYEASTTSSYDDRRLVG